MQTARHFRLLLAIAALALAAGGGQAAPHKRKSAVVGQGDGPIMSMAELRACMARQTRLSTQRQETVQAQAQMNTEGEALSKEGEALKAELETIDRTNKELLEDYVARAKAHDAHVDDYQARVPAFNAKVEALGTEQAAYSKACEGRRYLEDDYTDIKAGK
ncbi:MAG: hypothetical protein KF891_01980 [Rhizobacter sp.]|nr:hypothetical protein [Rhizobacter sp.]